MRSRTPLHTPSFSSEMDFTDFRIAKNIEPSPLNRVTGLNLGSEICSRQWSKFSFCLNGRARLKEKNGCIEDRRQNSISPQSVLAVNFFSRGTLSLFTWKTSFSCSKPARAMEWSEGFYFCISHRKTRCVLFSPAFHHEI